MSIRQVWIKDGDFASRPKKNNGADFQEKALYDQFSMVCIATTTIGPVVRWNMAAANWSSLLLAAKVISIYPIRVQLMFFNSGWFTESYQTGEEAAKRIELLMSRGDMHLKHRAFTTAAHHDAYNAPITVKRALETGRASDESSIICVLDQDRESNYVSQVGAETPIAKIWGVALNTYPCLSGHGYDREVSQKYFQVAQTGRPQYDQVLASMMQPNGEVHWLAYHRVILPDSNSHQQRVRIVSEGAPVMIDVF
jgi:hypothetical protein